MKYKRVLFFGIFFCLLIGKGITAEEAGQYPLTRNGFFQLKADLDSDKSAVKDQAQKSLENQFREMESFFYSAKDLSPEVIRIFHQIRDKKKRESIEQFKRSFSLQFLGAKRSDRPFRIGKTEKKAVSVQMKIKWPESLFVQNILLDQSKIQYTDSEGICWEPLSLNVQREIFLDPDQNECELEIKLIAKEDRPSKTDLAKKEEIKKKNSGKLTVGFSVLGGIEERILVFPYLLKQRFIGKTIERGDLRLSLFKETKEESRILLRIGIHYANPHEIFESHRNYMQNLECILIRYDLGGKEIGRENPSAILPVYRIEKEAAADLVFEQKKTLEREETDSADLMVRVPVYILSINTVLETMCTESEGDRK
ncbi:MAG: hypothetical protein Q4G69_08560 [Planctomycetia bacterium]|nr:hypothetical protein [Planctomycetia bacterium]